jgi:hypothetical protein
VNDRSIESKDPNPIRREQVGEPAAKWRSPERILGTELKIAQGGRLADVLGGCWCGWGWNGRKVLRVNCGDLYGHRVGVHAPVAEEPRSTGVRAPILAKKPGNSGGAKERRKVDA